MGKSRRGRLVLWVRRLVDSSTCPFLFNIEPCVFFRLVG